jgi:hypothetical protein
MDTDWFGFALILGVIAIGTPVLFFFYKAVTYLWRRASGSSDKKSPTTNVTPHALLATALLLTVVFIMPVFWMVSFPSREGRNVFLALWIGSFVALIFAEKHLLANAKYKDSWWCRPLGDSEGKSS